MAAHCGLAPSHLRRAPPWAGFIAAAPEGGKFFFFFGGAPCAGGFLRDPGNLIGLEAVTLEAGTPPAPARWKSKPADSTMAYEPNGIITAVRLPHPAAVKLAATWWWEFQGHWERAPSEAARCCLAPALALLHSLLPAGG